MLCVHLGPGPLGLGLIVEQVSKAGFDVCLIGPPDPGPGLAERQEYGIAFADPDLGYQPGDVRWPCNPKTLADLPPAVLETIAAREPMLITAALGAKITERQGLIIELLARRPPGAETVLLACENDPHPAYQTIASACGADLLRYDCVVDRLCSLPRSIVFDEEGNLSVITHPRDDRGRRVVSVHPTGEWVISAPTRESAVLAQLARAPLFNITGEPIDFYARRKRWLVGGLHMVLALIARREGADLLPLQPGYADAFLARARPLMAQISAGLHGDPAGIRIEHDYTEQRIRAFLEAPDTTARILERHLLRADLRGLMARLQVRVADAARAARDAGQDCEPFYDVMALLVSVLASPSSYYDEIAAALDPDIDGEVILLFEQALAGWLEQRRAQDLSQALTRALAAQRALGAPRSR